MAADPEKRDGAAEPQIPTLGTGEKSPEATTSSDEHGTPVSADEEQLDEKPRHSVQEDSHDDMDSNDDDDEDEEDEEHHDPEPEGPEGLNIGFPPDREAGLAAGTGTRTRTRSRSRASSARSRPLSVVPRRKRRGLFAQFALIPEVDRPYDYSRKTKWIITTIVALAAAGGPIGSNIFYRTLRLPVLCCVCVCLPGRDGAPGAGIRLVVVVVWGSLADCCVGVAALSEMATYFDTSETIVNLTVAFYMLSMSIFPLWWYVQAVNLDLAGRVSLTLNRSSFSESLGRRTIYVISFSLFAVFGVLSAISTNIAMLIVFRVLGGGAAASVQAVGAGTISDLWEPVERGRAMGRSSCYSAYGACGTRVTY